ncbi:MAG: hypothetical protein ATN36_03705 [Epulopiscium sp. Nele67-Bin005]|nr:MAG: hypothetical protein ATN36_03705 [Epulopiscium sp. Nele67-Bin005]
MNFLLLICVTLLIFVTLVAVSLNKKLQQLSKEHENLTNIMDAIPFMISATNNNKEWTFVNKVCAEAIGKPRKELIGKLCSSWNADICGTDKCGINTLNAGKLQSTCVLGGYDFQIDCAYIKDANGKTTGHLEFVQNVTHVTQLINSQQNLLDEVSTAVDNFGEFSNVIGKCSNELSLTATNQADVSQQFITSIDELSSNLEVNIQKITETNSIALNGREKAHNSREHMKSLISNMDAISQSSQNIADVLKIIESIASQTNLLALNAAIESARAGEAGKGFAVVANEIRELATKSSETVKEIEAIIKTSLKNVDKGQAIVNKTSSSLLDVVSSIEETAELSEILLENSKAQQLSINQLNTGTQQLSIISASNVTSAQDNLHVNNDMTSQIETLRKVIENK